MKQQLASRQTIIALAALSLLTLATALLVEATLQVAARIFPHTAIVLFPSWFGEEPLEVSDSELGIRGNPKFPEHDANGFRNPGVPDRTDVVAIGDSQTYGTGVAFEQAWPQQMKKLSSCRIYSMAMGGYAPLHYAILARQAIQLHPRLMFIGIYFGNDFYENWEMHVRNPSRYPVPTELLNAAVERDRNAPLSHDVFEFFHMGQAQPGNETKKSDREQKERWSLRTFLSRNSSLWGFARAVRDRLFHSQDGILSNDFRTAVAALTPKQLEYVSVFEGPTWRTILTSRYREALEQLEDPRIRVGVWLTQWAMRDIGDTATRNGIDVVFVLIPTKESVFADKVKMRENHRYFDRLTAEEDRVRRDLIQYMEKNNLAYVDLAPTLRSQARQPYFENADGHLNVTGNKAVATKLQEWTGVCTHLTAL
jgi:hypothetical protein